MLYFSLLSAGSTLFVQEGTYHEKIVLPESLQGKSQGYICIAASPENSRPALLSGSGFTDDFCILSVEGASYIRISGLTFTDAYGLDAAGILIYPPSHHITVEQCTFTNIRVPEPAVQDHVANGISCFGDSAEAAITDILISGNSFSDMATGWGECISVTGNCAYIQIEENVVRNTGNIGIDVGGNYGYCSDPALDFARHVLICGNTVSDCESAYGDTAYGIYADGGQHIQIINNTVSGCSGGIEAGAEEPQKSEQYAACDILIKGNVVTGSTDCALSIGGYERNRGMVRSVTVTENVFTDNANKSDGAIVTLSKCDDITISGNSFVHTDGSFLGTVLYKTFPADYPTTLVISGNTYAGLSPADTQ